MKSIKTFLASVLLALFTLPELVLAASVQPVKLLTEYSENPTGIDIAQPRLSWQLQGEGRDLTQSAWQVRVASSQALLERGRADLWDSGRTHTDQHLHIPYAGKTLASSQQVFWQVRVWDQERKASDWSAPASWTMGLLAEDDWKGKWIASSEAMSSVLMRRAFSVKPGLTRAVFHGLGLGTYEVMLNGQKVGEDLLAPGWTNFDKTTLYETRDITEQLSEGENVLGFVLGSGMYHVQRLNRFAKFTGSFGPLRAIAHVRLEYADGSVEFFGTDENWRVHRGPVIYNSIYGGEDYDARLEQSGWDAPGFEDSHWPRAVQVLRLPHTLRGHSASALPVRAIETRTPVAVRDFEDGSQVYDMGQNTSYMPRIRVAGPAGSTIRLTPSEVLYPDGTINRNTTGGYHRGSAWWQYTKATDDEEEWFPQFYYRGARYFKAEYFPPHPEGLAPTTADSPELDEDSQVPELVSLEGVIVHSISSPVGEFASGDELLQDIRQLVRWAQRSNMVSVLTDCPHREKLGWLEQYHLNGPAFRYEFDIASIVRKTMNDIQDSQTSDGLVPNIAPEYVVFEGAFRSAAEWGASYILIPWQQYQFGGDLNLLREYYDSMQRYFSYLESRAKNDILDDGLGDWYDLGPNRPGRAQLTFSPLTATAFLFHNAEVLSEAARLIGKPEDAERYAQRAAQIRARFNQEFYKPELGSYVGRSQTANAIPLVMGLVEPQHREQVLAALVQDIVERDYAVTAGGVGFRYVLQALAEADRSDVIYHLISQDDKPGYAYQLKQGATALTESWDSNHTSSHNHFMLGHITEWFYRNLAGIQPDPAEPGFRRVRFYPAVLDGPEWVEASYDSIRGGIHARWEKRDESLNYQVSLPAGTRGTVYFPAPRNARVLESGRPVEVQEGVTYLGYESGRHIYAIRSGEYRFALAE